MSPRVIEIEANTLDEAKALAYAQIPDGFFVYSESIISDGMSKTVQATQDSLEEAEKEAEWKIPRQANVLQRTNEVVTERDTVNIDDYTEEGARQRAPWIIPGKIDSIQLHKQGSKGFLGLGREKNTYRVTCLRERHIVEIVYQEKAKIHLTLDKEWTDELKLDFLRAFFLGPDSSFSTNSYSHFDARYREWCQRHDKMPGNKSGGYSFYRAFNDLIYDDAHGDDAWNDFRLTEIGKAFLLSDGKPLT